MQDDAEASRDVDELRIDRQGEGDGKVQASAADDDSPAAGEAPHYWHSVVLAALFEHLVCRVSKPAEYDGRGVGFPQSPTVNGLTVFDPLEQPPVLGQVLLSRPFEFLHGSEA